MKDIFMYLVNLEFSEEIKQENSGSINGGTDFLTKDTDLDLDFTIEIKFDITSQSPEGCFDNLINIGEFSALTVETGGNFTESGYYEDSDSHICEVSGSFSSVAFPFEIG